MKQYFLLLKLGADPLLDMPTAMVAFVAMQSIV